MLISFIKSKEQSLYTGKYLLTSTRVYVRRVSMYDAKGVEIYLF